MLISNFAAPAALFSCLAGLAHAGDISVTVSGVVPNGSNVYAALCEGNLEPSSCHNGQRKPGTAATVQFQFQGLSPGRYAIVAFQDLNGSGALERSPLGLPLEPYGFSNEAGRKAKPTFEAAAISIGEASRNVQLRLKGLARPLAGDQ